MRILMKDYNLDSFQEKDLYDFEEIIYKIEDLETELKTLKNDFDNYKQNVEDNYERIPVSKQVQIDDKDF
jgi:hypothetical protein